MDQEFFSKWFKGFEEGLAALDAESRSDLLKYCAKQCVDTGVLQAYLRHFDTVCGDRDAFYRRLHEVGNVRGEVIIPGKEYEICFPECSCDLHTACGVNTSNLCECSRQSILYVNRTVWKGCDLRVESEGTILSRAPECRFKVIFNNNQS